MARTRAGTLNGPALPTRGRPRASGRRSLLVLCVALRLHSASSREAGPLRSGLQEQAMHKVLMERWLKNAGDDTGAVGYILAWLLGVPASVLFLFFLMRGCT